MEFEDQIANLPARRAVPGRRAFLLALTLLLGCAKGATRSEAPERELHYPAWIASFGQQLLVVNLDQDLAFDHGALVALDVNATSGEVLGGVPVPNMAGQLAVIDHDALVQAAPDDGGATAAACEAALAKAGYPVPFALVAGRFESALYLVELTPGAASDMPLGNQTRIDLNPASAAVPFGIGFTCSAGTPRAWVGYMAGQDGIGYLSQVGFPANPGEPFAVVQVNVGMGAPRGFAYDPDHDRLYFTSREQNLVAPVRWIQVGNGCQTFSGGIQDERKGGCHVDPGFDVSRQLRGAEPNEIALSSTRFPCTTGSPGELCRRMYLSVRMYDADLASFMGGRPTGDVGGRFMVLELPEGGLGAPVPQVVADAEIGVIAGSLHVVRRPPQQDVVAVTAVDDHLLWIWDDDAGAMVAVFGRNAIGVPDLGHRPTGIAGQDLGTGTVRLFVTSYSDHFVSAVDVPVGSPAGAALVREGTDVKRWGQTP